MHLELFILPPPILGKKHFFAWMASPHFVHFWFCAFFMCPVLTNQPSHFVHSDLYLWKQLSLLSKFADLHVEEIPYWLVDSIAVKQKKL